MSDYAANGAKTNWPWHDALPGYWWGQDRAVSARRHYKRVMVRNRRRMDRAVVNDQMADFDFADFDEAYALSSQPPQCHCADCVAGVTE